MIKCELIVEGYSYRATNDVMNWNDVNISLKRGDYDGVTRSFSSKFEFVNTAYALLKKQYRNNYLGAAASIVISRRNNSWTWDELFRCTLDFSTYEDSGNVISINAVDDSLASLIKAKKGTQYEYAVDEIKEEQQLYYDRIRIQNVLTFYPYSKAYGAGHNKEEEGGESVISFDVQPSNQANYYDLPLLYSESSDASDMKPITIIGDDAHPGSLVEFNQSSIDMKVALKFKLSADSDSHVSISIRVEQGSENHIVDERVFQFVGDGKDVDYQVVIPKYYISATGKIYIRFHYAVSNGKRWIAIGGDKKVNVIYTSRDKPVNINAITPLVLLNRLLNSINGGNLGITGEIESSHDKRLDNSLVIAAESVRDIEKAKLYSSFSKFAEWMKAEFGYVYDISDKKVTFRHRTKYFSNEIVKKVTEFEDFSYSVNSSLIYSSVKIGYDKQDYDSINGRDEFRFTNTFSTGKSLTDNTLDLISPYRADAYGLEFLVQKRGKDTTDTESDNDVFFVGAKLSQDGSRYELVRNGYNLLGVISPETMFNAMYSPRQMLLANLGFIGMCTGKLTYTSGEGNSDVLVNGVREKDDISIPDNERIATVGELSFSTPEFDMPNNRIGMVSLIRNGETYLGYIQKADMNAGHEECTKFMLSVKDIQ